MTNYEFYKMAIEEGKKLSIAGRQKAWVKSRQKNRDWTTPISKVPVYGEIITFPNGSVIKVEPSALTKKGLIRKPLREKLSQYKKIALAEKGEYVLS